VMYYDCGHPVFPEHPETNNPTPAWMALDNVETYDNDDEYFTVGERRFSTWEIRNVSLDVHDGKINCFVTITLDHNRGMKRRVI